MNPAINSLLQAARRSCGMEYFKDVIGDKKKVSKKSPKEKIPPPDESDEDDSPPPKRQLSLSGHGGKTKVDLQQKRQLSSADDSGEDGSGHGNKGKLGDTLSPQQKRQLSAPDYSEKDVSGC